MKTFKEVKERIDEELKEQHEMGEETKEIVLDRDDVVALLPEGDFDMEIFTNKTFTEYKFKSWTRLPNAIVIEVTG